MADRLITLENMIYEANQEFLNGQQGVRTKDYVEIKEKIEQLISTNHAEELARSLSSQTEEQREQLVSLIIRYLNEEQLVDNTQSVRELAEHICEDMAGYGFLRPYLEDPDVEEVNINGPNSIWVIYPNRKVLLSVKFNSVEECMHIVQKMARAGTVILDGSKPYGDSYISKGVRMSGAIAPCVDEEVGGTASIRKQKKVKLTREDLVGSGAVLGEALDFISTCLESDVSVTFSGSTGSGKTANMGYALSTIDDETRIFTIEDTKELDLPVVNAAGIVCNDVVQMYTKDGVISMNDLLKLSLRYHPKIIVPAEMRGAEAMTAQEAGRTGHTIVSSLHANNARNAYKRILTMCMESGTNLSETLMLENIVEAFPIIVFCKQLKDNSRRWMEIFEATGVEQGKVVGQSLYRYVIDHSEKDEHGKVRKVYGEHRKVGCISENLAETLRMNSVDEEVIEQYAGKRERW